ncbi:MAG: SDR family NAD(P)-dependent oxidoreductase [Verrucomicrobia bacterium]|nr:SDR family NAD(P)-dependent oxidoreductase [Verrucomicrobiota bacterium]MBU1908628.1 SDR family NAD(P)-dependent oxidoreductase [Verrucomicrobiota bacterium]
MKAAPVQSRTALVTGCSTGIGLATAHLLRDRGWTVWPTARKADDLARLRAEGFDPIALDLLDPESAQGAADEALKRGGGHLGALINNAGYGQPGAVEDLTPTALRRQFEVNVFGLQELTSHVLPAMQQQGYGRIVNVSSVLGWVTIPFMGAYCASKHALESLSAALRIELRGSGVAVSLVEPGPIETEFRKNAFEHGREHLDAGRSRFAKLYEGQGRRKMAKGFRSSDPFTAPPEAVARRIIHALESARPRRHYPITFTAHAMYYLRRVLPEALKDWLMSFRLR